MTERGLWRYAYRELLRPRSVAGALASVVLFLVVTTIFGPLGTLESLQPLPRFAYWGLCAAITFPLCYAVAATVLYLARLGSLIEIAAASLLAVLFEGLLCTTVVVVADLLFIPHAQPSLVDSTELGRTYLTVTAVLAACTFFSQYAVFLRIHHARTATAADQAAHGTAAPPAQHDPAPAAASGSVTADATGSTGKAGTPARGGPEAPPGAVRPLRSADQGKPTPRQARFYDRLSRRVSRDVVYLKMDDHYVNVCTTGGSCLISMRFMDAVEELGASGMQVHRSYWVAYRHMLATGRRDGRPIVHLSGGHHVPISRPYLPAVNDALHAKADRGRESPNPRM